MQTELSKIVLNSEESQVFCTKSACLQKSVEPLTLRLWSSALDHAYVSQQN